MKTTQENLSLHPEKNTTFWLQKQKQLIYAWPAYWRFLACIKNNFKGVFKGLINPSFSD